MFKIPDFRRVFFNNRKTPLDFEKKVRFMSKYIGTIYVI